MASTMGLNFKVSTRYMDGEPVERTVVIVVTKIRYQTIGTTIRGRQTRMKVYWAVPPLSIACQNWPPVTLVIR